MKTLLSKLTRSGRANRRAGQRHRRRPLTAAIETLETRQLMSATPLDVSTALAQSREYDSRTVAQAYQTYLGRAPDATGFNHWVNRLQAGMREEQLEATFIGSPEYIANHGGTGAAWVDGMYRDLLNRSPDAAGQQYWQRQLAAGANPASIALGFAASPERKAIQVGQIYASVLGRSPSSPEVNYWVHSYQTGMTSERILAGFVGSQEFVSRSGSIPQWLTSAYQTILGRAPDGASYAAWLGALGYQGNGGSGDDQFEENDHISQSANLGTLASTRTITGLRMLDARDFFRFRMAGTGTSSDHVRIEFQHSQGDLDLALYDSTGTLIRRSDSTTNAEQVSLAGLPAGDYFVEVYGYQGAHNPDYRLTIDPAGSTSAGGGRRTLYLNFDGAGMSYQDLVRWSRNQWQFMDAIDPERDGIRVAPYLAGQANREQMIQSIMSYVQRGLNPLGITVQRHHGLAVENVGTTTIFIGPDNMQGSFGGIASDLDYGNDNWTDIAFARPTTFGDAASTARRMADRLLHEAGHTFGLFHVNTNQNNSIYTETMGLSYTVGRYGAPSNSWPETSYQDRTFYEWQDDRGNWHSGLTGAHPKLQNSYQTLLRNFGLAGAANQQSLSTIDVSEEGVFAITTSGDADRVVVRQHGAESVEITINGQQHVIQGGLERIQLHTAGDARDQIEIVGDLDIELIVETRDLAWSSLREKVQEDSAAGWNGAQLAAILDGRATGSHGHEEHGHDTDERHVDEAVFQEFDVRASQFDSRLAGFIGFTESDRRSGAAIDYLHGRIGENVTGELARADGELGDGLGLAPSGPAQFAQSAEDSSASRASRAPSARAALAHDDALTTLTFDGETEWVFAA